MGGRGLEPGRNGIGRGQEVGAEIKRHSFAVYYCLSPNQNQFPAKFFLLPFNVHRDVK